MQSSCYNQRREPGGSAAQCAIADAILWGGVFIFINSGVNAVKAGVRGIKNAKLAGSAQTGSQPCKYYVPTLHYQLHNKYGSLQLKSCMWFRI